MVNVILLAGRLTRDPDLRYTPGGEPVCKFSLAVERGYTSKEGTRETDFFDCTAFRKLAETCGEHLKKGRLVFAQGRLQIRSYTTKDGAARKVPEIILSEVRFLEKKADAETEKPVAPEEFGEEVPGEDVPF
jgi:single-strand DNA-binding protein